MGAKIEKNENNTLNGCTFGDYSVVNNCFASKENNEFQVFIEQGKKMREKYEPCSQEYEVLNAAIVYAERNEKNKFVEMLKRFSIDAWQQIFSGVASGVVIELIKRWIA